jgi:hypothetical protein
MAIDKKYDVFISYSRKDAAYAEKICSAFDEAGIKYFIDKKGIGGTANYVTTIANEIDNSKIILFLASANSYASKYVGIEVHYAFNHNVTVLPYALDQTPIPKDFELLLIRTNWHYLKTQPIKPDLMHAVAELIGKHDISNPTKSSSQTSSGTGKRKKWYVALAIGLLLLAAGLSVLFLIPPSAPSVIESTPPTASVDTRIQDSIELALATEREKLRLQRYQDSVERTLQMEAERIAQERTALEKAKKDRQNVQTTKTTPKTNATASTKEVETTVDRSTQISTPPVTPPQTVTPSESTPKTIDKTPVSKQSSEPFVHAGHEYVDLGLSVLWATCNIGATKPTMAGKYFAWGETQPKENYNWNTYKHCTTGPYDFTKYCKNTNTYNADFTDNKSCLEPVDDAAHVLWGEGWRMPTPNELQELIKKCKWTPATRDGVKGQLGTGPNGNTIFLPIAGIYLGTNLSSAGYSGAYWSNALDGAFIKSATHMYVNAIKPNIAAKERFLGANIRPVLVRAIVE